MTGGRWLEGPSGSATAATCCSPTSRTTDALLRELTGEVVAFRSPSDNSNGNTRDRRGRLVTCEHRTRRVTRTEHDGLITVLMDGFDGKAERTQRRDRPPDGSVWFTDPGWGIESNHEGARAVKQLPARLMYTTGGTPAITGMDRPNGLLSRRDPALRRRRRRDPRLRHGRHDSVNGRPFVEFPGPGGSDGIRTDRLGNLWPAAAGGAGFDGVHCYSPDGALVGQLHLPESCANLCFGGPKKNRLFMTASSSLYSVYVEAQGAQHP